MIVKLTQPWHVNHITHNTSYQYQVIMSLFAQNDLLFADCQCQTGVDSTKEHQLSYLCHVSRFECQRRKVPQLNGCICMLCYH